MSQLLEEHDELLAAQGRELTLSTGAILSIFVGLALLCGLFFGFGYNVGRKSAASAVLAASAEPSTPASSSAGTGEVFDKFKPSAATPAKESTPAPADRQEEAESAAAIAPAPDAAKSSTIPHPESAERSASAPPSTKPGIATSAPGPGETAAAAGTAGTFFVQVAAVSHPDDASMLMAALRARGYAITQRSEPGDKLIHIQVGPFGAKPVAEAMRQRLQGDGYNAIIK